MTLAHGLIPAVVALLRADDGVMALCTGRVQAEAVASTVFPHVVVGAVRGRAWNAGDERGEEIVFALDCFARQGGRELALDLAAACADALDGAAPAFSGARIVTLTLQDSEVALLKDGQTWRATARFRALVEAT